MISILVMAISCQIAGNRCGRVLVQIDARQEISHVDEILHKLGVTFEINFTNSCYI
jgi:hypothetical protein